MGIRGELYTTQIVLDKRSYFFNVKENRTGDVFLQIVESKKNDGVDFDRHQVAIFAEDMQKFLKGLESSLAFIEKDKKEKAKILAEKKAAKEAKYKNNFNDSKKVYKRKSTKENNNERTFTPQIKKTGRVHVVSKRKSEE